VEQDLRVPQDQLVQVELMELLAVLERLVCLELVDRQDLLGLQVLKGFQGLQAQQAQVEHLEQLERQGLPDPPEVLVVVEQLDQLELRVQLDQQVLPGVQGHLERPVWQVRQERSVPLVYRVLSGLQVCWEPLALPAQREPRVRSARPVRLDYLELLEAQGVLDQLETQEDLVRLDCLDQREHLVPQE